jgi:hypothetical protein
MIPVLSPRQPVCGRRRIVTAVVATLVLGGFVSAAGAVPPGGPVDASNGATVSIDRTTVKAGGRIGVRGRNWKSTRSRTEAGAVVTIKLDDRDILQLLKITNKRFSGWVRIPRQVKAGKHRLRFLAGSPATSVKSKLFRVTR